MALALYGNNNNNMVADPKASSTYQFSFVVAGKVCTVTLEHTHGEWQIKVEDSVVTTNQHGKVNPFKGADYTLKFPINVESYEKQLNGEINAAWVVRQCKWVYKCMVAGTNVPLTWSNSKGVINTNIPEVIPVELKEDAANENEGIADRMKKLEELAGNLSRQLNNQIRENDGLSKKVFSLEEQLKNGSRKGSIDSVGVKPKAKSAPVKVVNKKPQALPDLPGEDGPGAFMPISNLPNNSQPFRAHFYVDIVPMDNI